MLGDVDLARVEETERPQEVPHECRIRLTLLRMAAKIMPLWSEFRTVEPGNFLLHCGLVCTVEAEGSDLGAPTSLPVKQPRR